jgi:hypothetical protein
MRIRACRKRKVRYHRGYKELRIQVETFLHVEEALMPRRPDMLPCWLVLIRVCLRQKLRYPHGYQELRIPLKALPHVEGALV